MHRLRWKGSKWWDRWWRVRGDSDMPCGMASQTHANSQPCIPVWLPQFYLVDTYIFCYIQGVSVLYYRTHFRITSDYMSASFEQNTIPWGRIITLSNRTSYYGMYSLYPFRRRIVEKAYYFRIHQPAPPIVLNTSERQSNEEHSTGQLEGMRINTYAWHRLQHNQTNTINTSQYRR